MGLAVTNNNPGNLRDTSTGGFRSFSTPQEGFAALLNDLQSKQTGTTTTGLGPGSTLVDFASKYAPGTDNNKPGEYAANLANKMGVAPTTHLKDLDLMKWATAVAHNEDTSSTFGNANPVSGLLQGPQAQGDNYSGGLVQPQSGNSQLDSQISQLTQTIPPTSQADESLGSKLQGRGQQAIGALGLAGQGINEATSGHPLRGLFDVGSGALQTAGAAAGGAGDVIGSAIGLVPGVKQVEGLIGKGVGKLAQTQAGQSVISAGQDFAAKHPVVAGDIGAAANIGGLVGGGIGGKLAKDAVEEGVVQGARKGVLGGLAKDVAQKSTTKQAEELLASTPTKGVVKSALHSGRISTEGGIPGVVNDPLKQASVKEVAQAIMDGKIPKGLVADKAGAIKKAADSMAVDLEKKLGGMEIQPIVHPDEIHNLLNGALQKIGEDPTMVGNAEESAKRILNKFNSYLPKDRDITALDILKARKNLDQWIGGLSGGSNVFDPAYENAKSIALRAIRQGANDLVASKAPDIAVKELLQRQSNLYRALDYIAPNVKKEIGTTPFSRFASRHPLIVGGIKTAAKATAAGAGFKGAEHLF